MKTLIIALNSKYIHSSLSAWYLKAACGHEVGEVRVLEYTINDNLDSVLSSIYLEKADIAAFSCYIWNITYVLRLIESLKKVSPGLKIVLGGPEVSYDSQDVSVMNESVDFIISGEGEKAFPLLLKHIKHNSDELDGIEGLTYRKNGSVCKNGGFNLVENLDSIPSPYTDEMLLAIGEKRIVYYESSRGCPFSCSYCISSTFEGVRTFSMDRIKSDILKLIKKKVIQVKFVDRTFNCNRHRAMEILSFVIENAGDTNFHFEAGGDLFDEDMLELLARAPKGLIQFEIGIQTVNEKTLESINRKTNLDKLYRNVERLRMQGNVHLHLDLIAGLPYEDYESFKNSFNKVYSLKPHQLQLGFLKLLKGSSIREHAKEHLYKYRNYPPYEILCSRYLSFDETIKLKEIEELVERYHNSGKFQQTLKYLIDNHFESAFGFFEDLRIYCRETGFYQKALSARELYNILMKFAVEVIDVCNVELVNELLKLDFLSTDSSNNLPEGLVREKNINVNELAFEFLKQEANVTEYLPRFLGVPPKQIFKKVHMEVFSYDIISGDLKKEKAVVLFNYSVRDKITGLYEYRKIENIKFNEGGFYTYEQ